MFAFCTLRSFQVAILQHKFGELRIKHREILHTQHRINSNYKDFSGKSISELVAGKEIELQYLSKLFFRTSGIIIRNLEEWCAAEAEAVDLRRRRASSSAETTEETETEEGEERHCSRSSSLENDVVSEDDETVAERDELSFSQRNHEIQHRIQSLLVALLHAATSLAPHVYNDKVPSALHCVNFNEYLKFLCLKFVKSSYQYIGRITNQ